MFNKTLLSILVVCCVSSLIQGKVIFQDDFESYPIANPYVFAAGEPWTTSSEARDATRTFVTGNMGGTNLWVSNIDGTKISLKPGKVLSQPMTQYRLTFLAACETYRADRLLKVDVEVKVNGVSVDKSQVSDYEGLVAAQVVAGTAARVMAHGDDWQLADSKDDHYFSLEFASGVAGGDIVVEITRVGPEGSGSWFSIDDVTIEELQSVRGPQLVAPEDKAQDVTVTPTFEWSEPSLGTVDSYTLSYCDCNDFVGATVISGLSNLTESYTVVTPLDNFTTYYWKVSTLSSGQTYDSAVWSLTTLPASPVLMVSPESITLAAGETVMLECEALNNPTYTWYRSADYSNATSGDDTTVGTGSTLTFTMAQDKEGFYYCIANNSAGQAVTEPVYVMTARLVLHMQFENSLADSAMGAIGAFSDPNTNPNDRYVADGYFGTAFSFQGDGGHVELPGGDEWAFYPQGITYLYWAKQLENTGNWLSGDQRQRR